MSSSSKQASSQSQSTTTTQIDRRIAAADQGVVGQNSTILQQGSVQVGGGSTIYNESLDPATIAAALGLSGDVAEAVARFATEAQDSQTNVALSSIQETSDIAREALTGANAVSLDLIGATTNLANDVSGNAFDYAQGLAESALYESFGFGRDISGDANELAMAALNKLGTANLEANRLSETSQATVSRALEGFGTELSKVKAIEVSGGLTETNKAVQLAVIGATIAAIVGTLAYLFTRKQKPA